MMMMERRASEHERQTAYVNNVYEGHDERERGREGERARRKKSMKGREKAFVLLAVMTIM
jgi:hypothetical protein